MEKFIKTRTNTGIHNVAEDAVRQKAPEIMTGMGICVCEDCINDVMALALNSIPPMYTVTEEGALIKKLSALESQYGTDVVGSITKACLKISENPNHHPPIK